ncbi:MAG: class I SAM-dependent methyltransferase [Thermoplasmata archaeon]
MSTTVVQGITSPLPAREYVADLFDWLAPHYDRAVLLYTLAQDLRWKAELVRRLRPRRGERALDLACGTGLIYERITQFLGPDAVVGLDVNRSMLSGARRGHSDRQMVRADSLNLPFRDASFDLVTAGYLFKYVPLDSLSGEIRRVLRPGGRFGGYDFSAPDVGTVSGSAYDWYLHQILPVLGRWWGRGDAGWTQLLEFLARIAANSQWETRVEAEFRDAGFDRVRRVEANGGAVTWVWAWLPRAPERQAI